MFHKTTERGYKCMSDGDLLELHLLTASRVRELEKLLDDIPPCPGHGKGCIPHAWEWIQRMKELDGQTMTATITLAETQQAKSELEATIRDALARFSAKTGVLVTGVNLTSMTISQDDVVVSGPRYKVAVEVKL